MFYHSLLRPTTKKPGLRGQEKINKAESYNIRGRVLEQDDDIEEVVEKWEFDGLLDYYNKDSYHYLIK
jgi:hypothetical protein